MSEICALAFQEGLSYINSIDLLREDGVFLSFCLHIASIQCFQHKATISFDSCQPPNFLLFWHVRHLCQATCSMDSVYPAGVGFLARHPRVGTLPMAAPPWQGAAPMALGGSQQRREAMGLRHGGVVMGMRPRPDTVSQHTGMGQGVLTV